MDYEILRPNPRMQPTRNKPRAADAYPLAGVPTRLGQVTSKEFNVPPDTLSAKQLDQLPAGPELDALVAEKVLEETKPLGGHEDVHLEPRKSHDGNWLCWPEYDRGAVCESAPAPFSTDIRAAWEVAEKRHAELWKRGIVFEMGNNPHNPKRAWWVNLIFPEQRGRHETEITYAETMSLAICRTALKAALSSNTRARQPHAAADGRDSGGAHVVGTAISGWWSRRPPLSVGRSGKEESP